MFKAIDRFGLFLKRCSISKKKLAVIFVVGFVLTLIPIIITCFYSVPVYDDYNFGYYTHKSVIEGNNFFSAIIETNNHFYSNWQGFFTYNIVASAQPFNINSDLYFISNLLVILTLIASLLYFGKIILKDVLEFDSINYILITIPIITMILQFLPDIAEAFYWMDGSLIVLIHSLLLFEVSLLIKIHLLDNRKRIVYSIFVIIVAVIISGTDAITFLTNILLLSVSLIYSIKKKYKENKIIIALLLITIIGFFVALLAPGNQVRLSIVDESSKLSFISAIMYALLYSVSYFGNWMTICFIAVLIFCSVIFYNIAKNSKYSFKNPLLVFILTYGLYAARMSVELYALGTLGSGRQYDVYYMFFIICFSISVLYFVGWLSKRDNFKVDIKKANKISMIFMIVVVFVFISGCFDFGIKKISSVATTVSLIKGDTQKYNYEMKDRIAILEESDEEEIVFSPISVYPPVFMSEPLSDDADYWTNSSTAKYYNKKTINLIK